MCMITDSPEFARRMTELPPLPAAVAEVLDALRHGPPSLERCVELIERDPALAARTLRLANSAFYGVSGRVASLSDAVHLLGRHTLSTLLTAATVKAQFTDEAHLRRTIDKIVATDKGTQIGETVLPMSKMRGVTAWPRRRRGSAPTCRRSLSPRPSTPAWPSREWSPSPPRFSPASSCW